MATRPRILPDLSQPKRPWNTVEGDVTGSLAKSLQRAAGAGESVPSPVQAMRIEHEKLLKAFRETEGRDPSPDLNSDRDFWLAYGEIMETRVGKSFIGEEDSAAGSVRKVLGS